MTTYGAPGVYVNQTPATVTTSAGNIPGEAVAAFAANYNAGPTVPTFITNWNQFSQLFGGFKSGSSSVLPFAVYQYFSNGGTGCFVFRVANSDAVQAAMTVADTNGPELAPPIAPVLTQQAGSSTIAAGTYKVETTYVNTDGETTAGPSSTIVVASSNVNTITITSPVTSLNATGWYAYVTQAGGSTYTRQQTLGSPTAIGTNLTLSAPPTSSGANPPVNNTTGVACMTVTALYPGAWGSNIYITIVPTSGTATALFNLQVYQGGTGPVNLVESWNGVSLNPTAPRYAPGMVNSTTAGSKYIKLSNFPTASTYVAGTSDPYQITTPTALGTITGSGQPAIISSTVGADGSTPIDLTWAITAGAFGTAPGSPPVWHQGSLASLSNQILNLNLPDASANGAVNYTLVNNIITWAQIVGNVYLLVDGFFGGGVATSAVVASNYTSMTQSGGSIVNASTVASIYGPWLSISDPSAGTSGATRWVPPSGAVLGYWAQNDVQNNVAQSPAGTTAVLSAVALEAYFTGTDLANLESAQINPIKSVPNSGFCVYGVLTTSPGYPNRYINISRTLMKIQHDLQFLTAFAVFQNNNSVLWQNVATVITNYLTQEMQDGLLAGTTPADSFNVICDGTVNTPTTIAAGIVNAQVAVAVSAPAEFVVITLSQMATGATTTVSS
jgi:hypothetical protein